MTPTSIDIWEFVPQGPGTTIVGQTLIRLLLLWLLLGAALLAAEPTPLAADKPLERSKWRQYLEALEDRLPRPQLPSFRLPQLSAAYTEAQAALERYQNITPLSRGDFESELNHPQDISNLDSLFKPPIQCSTITLLNGSTSYRICRDQAQVFALADASLPVDARLFELLRAQIWSQYLEKFSYGFITAVRRPLGALAAAAGSTLQLAESVEQLVTKLDEIKVLGINGRLILNMATGSAAGPILLLLEQQSVFWQEPLRSLLQLSESLAADLNLLERNVQQLEQHRELSLSAAAESLAALERTVSKITVLNDKISANQATLVNLSARLQELEEKAALGLFERLSRLLVEIAAMGEKIKDILILYQQPLTLITQSTAELAESLYGEYRETLQATYRERYEKHYSWLTALSDLSLVVAESGPIACDNEFSHMLTKLSALRKEAAQCHHHDLGLCMAALRQQQQLIALVPTGAWRDYSRCVLNERPLTAAGYQHFSVQINALFDDPALFSAELQGHSYALLLQQVLRQAPPNHAGKWLPAVLLLLGLLLWLSRKIRSRRSYC